MTVTESNPQSDLLKKRKHQEVQEDDEESSSEEEVQTLTIVVRRVGKAESESLTISLHSDASVQDLKERIAETLAKEEVVVPVERQRLIFSGKMLRDDSLLLEEDLNMKAGEDQKHFVHLTPLPKGAAPSVRTERELSENPLSPQEATLQRARARQRRRRRQEPRRGMTDPAAYRPYALDLTSGSLLPATTAAPAAAATSTAAWLSSTPAEEAALLSVAAAAEQSRLVQEVARRTVLPDAATLQAVLSLQPARTVLPDAATLQAVLLAQQPGLLGGATTAAGLVSAAAANPLCPLAAAQADTAASLLQSTLLAGRSAPTNSIFGAAAAQLQSPVAVAAAATLPIETNPTVAALQDMLGASRPRITTTGNGYLPEILDQIAMNAGELATTLRLLSPGTPATLPTVNYLPTSPPLNAAATVTSNNTPQDLATRLALEQSLATLSGSPAAAFLPGFPGLF